MISLSLIGGCFPVPRGLIGAIKNQVRVVLAPRDAVMAKLERVFSSGLSNRHDRSSVVQQCLLTCMRELDVFAVMDITIVVEFVLCVLGTHLQWNASLHSRRRSCVDNLQRS